MPTYSTSAMDPVLLEKLARLLCRTHYGLGDTDLCRRFEESRWDKFMPEAVAALDFFREQGFAQ